MTQSPSARLAALGLVLPTPAAPAANYVPVVRTGALLFVAGQLPMEAGALAVTGKLGAGVSPEEGKRAARLCAIHLIAQVAAAVDGDLDRVTRVVKLTGFVASTPDFLQHPAIVNGASDLMVDVFGDAGRHARAAVGVPCLPFDAAVEVEGVFEVAP